MNQDAFSEVSNSVDETLRRYIDDRSKRTGESREELCVEVGKALIMQGCSFIGNGLGIKDPDIGLQPGRDCLKKFQEIAGE